VTRDQFEELTADLLERTAYTTRQLLAAAGLEWGQVSRVLLVGGATRMPMVLWMLQQMSGTAPDHTVHPDEAVARGAALYAKYLLAQQVAEAPPPGFQVINVNSHSLGVEGIDPQTLRKINVVLIPRNTPLPARSAEKFTTRSAGQRSIVVQVLEGESSLPGECTAIGRTVIRDLPAGLPQGWPVEVTFEYATNGRLSVRAVVPGTQREETLELERDVGLSREGIARWKQTVASPAGFDAFEAMVVELLQQGDSATGSASPDSDQGDWGRWDAAPQAPASGPGEAVSSPATVPQPAGMQAAPEPGPPPSDAGPGPARPEPTDVAPPQGPAQRPVPKALISVVGFAVSAIVGLTLGYLILRWLLPDSRILQLW
jgi:hypothetical protein